MSIVIETTLGDITVDLFLNHRPRACLNFLKLCKIKYYNYNLFHTISRGFIAQTGDPTGMRKGGESIFGIIDGPSRRYFEAENEPRIKHTHPGLISFVGSEENMIGSQFFLTLGEDLTYLDEKHCVFGEVVEGIDILEAINEVICDTDDRPYQDVRITHTVVLDDPYPDPKGIRVPSRSPSPTAERLAGGRIAPDEEIDETSGKSAREIAERQAEREAKARATILEMIGDIPDVDVAPPENVLFVCKLNPVTTDDDLEIIFSRFGKIKSCEVIRDRKSGESLQYAFIEFEEQKSCEDAYFKMDNVLIDDRRIHVDFSQSVSKVKWLGKGRGVAYYDDKGKKSKIDVNNDIGKGNYKVKNGSNQKNSNYKENKMSGRARKRSRSPRQERSSERKRKQTSSPTERTRKKYSPKRRFRTPRRSRSPRRYQRYDNLHRRNDVSRRKSLSPRGRNTPPPRKVDKRYNRSRSKSGDIYSRGRDKKTEKDSKSHRVNEKSVNKSQKSNRNLKKSQQSSSESDSDMTDHDKDRKKKKKIEDSSHSDDDSSSEEEKMKKSSKKKLKKKSKKKAQKKKRYSSSSESTSSDSESCKKKKHRKKNTNDSDTD